MATVSLPCGKWADVLSSFPSDLDLDHSAIRFGALRRRRQISGGTDLLRLALAYGPCGMSLRSTATWATMCGLGELSDVAVLKRLKGAHEWLEHIVSALLSDAGGYSFQSGHRLRLVDGTCVSRPGSKGTDWRIHASYDPAGGRFTHFEITDGRGAESLTRSPVEARDIHVADRGYAYAKGLHKTLADGGDFLVRAGWRKFRYLLPNGSPLDLLSILPEAKDGTPLDLQVIIRGRTEADNVPARLIIIRKPPQAAELEKKRLRRLASKKGHKTVPSTLIAADYMLLVTSLPQNDFDISSLSALYRLRWQIELAFKRLKRLIHIDRLPAKDPALARTWLLAHLVLALLIERKSEECLSNAPSDEGEQARNPSIWRLHKMLLQALLSAIQGSWNLSGITRKASSFWRSIYEPPRKRKRQQIPKHSHLS